MALMERVATLLRANLNDLIDRAEEPEKMLKQLVLDIENQLLQVKTQVATALAHQHLLEKKASEQESAAGTWHRKAELAVNKGDDELARAALDRALSQGTMLAASRAQLAEQSAEAEALRATYLKLQAKLAETQAECDLLIAQHRRQRMLSRAAEARVAQEAGTVGPPRPQPVARMQERLSDLDASNKTADVMRSADSVEGRFAQMERDDRVEQLLSDLKSKQHRLLPTG